MSQLNFQFDANGYLKPYDIIETDLAHFERTFVTTTVRRMIFAEYLQFNAALKSLVDAPFDQWLDGSFTTRKPLPFDIDVVTFVDFDIFFKKKLQLERLKVQFVKVDAHFEAAYPPTHPRFYRTAFEQLYWKSVYQTDRFGRQKGFIHLKF